MKHLTIRMLGILLAVLPSASLAGQTSLILRDEDFVWEHNHRCDYKVRPLVDPNGRVEDRIWTYKDPMSGITLHVESDGRHLNAINARGAKLWRRDPHAGLHAYRVDPPCIFAIGPKSYQGGPTPKVPLQGAFHGKLVTIQEGKTGHYVFLEFDNSQFGYVAIRSGDFIWEGQN